MICVTFKSQQVNMCIIVSSHRWHHWVLCFRFLLTAMKVFKPDIKMFSEYLMWPDLTSSLYMNIITIICVCKDKMRNWINMNARSFDERFYQFRKSINHEIVLILLPQVATVELSPGTVLLVADRRSLWLVLCFSGQQPGLRHLQNK